MQINDAQPTVVPGVTADAPELATTDAQELSTTDAPELATTDDAPDITSDIEQIPESVVKTEPITSESTIGLISSYKYVEHSEIFEVHTCIMVKDLESSISHEICSVCLVN